MNVVKSIFYGGIIAVLFVVIAYCGISQYRTAKLNIMEEVEQNRQKEIFLYLCDTLYPSRYDECLNGWKQREKPYEHFIDF